MSPSVPAASPSVPAASPSVPAASPSARRPNLVFIMSDDHAAHAIGAYGSRINQTPNIDRIASQGMRFDHCYCTNSICTPSRAAILCGTYNHVNRVTTLDTPLDAALPTFPKLLQAHGYRTAIFGKWHLGDEPAHRPAGFDDWQVLPGQGDYHDPQFFTPGGTVRHRGYVTDIITDLSIDWIAGLDRDRAQSQPFALLCHHKAPHRPWEPDAAHADMYFDRDIPEPQTFWDDHATRSAAAAAARCRMMDLTEADLKAPVPEGLSHEQEISWRYQRYIKDYLRVVASVDDNVGRLLDALAELGHERDTMVVYTSDQGFFLGEHGWFDKRFMYEESLNMPLLVRWPDRIRPGSVNRDMVVNVDFAPTFCEAAGVEVPDGWQGRSLMPLFGADAPGGGASGGTPEDWPQSMYYRYWMHRDRDHEVRAHLGVRTRRHKLICFYGEPLGQPGAHGPSDPVEWELYDLKVDPFEVDNLFGRPGQEALTRELMDELKRLIEQVGDVPPDCLA